MALTGLLLLVFSPEESGLAQDTGAVVGDTVAALADTAAVAPDSLAREGTEEATRTLQGIWRDFHELLPKLGFAAAILFLAWLIGRLIRPVLRWSLRSWSRANAVIALVSIALWLIAIGIALSVVTGDFRALIGSLGLVGLALSWALQTPIESFTGWLLNSFRGYYRVGDRIAVGEVYGDVYRIDVLNTTVWEYGGPDRLGVHVRGEQATGRLITFPNNEILTGWVVNLTRDFPYVWDELQMEFSGASDATHLLSLMRRVADEVLGEQMRGPAREYRLILQGQGLEPWVAEEPQAFLDISEDGWLRVTVRYLVAARERRRWKSELVERVQAELKAPENRERVHGALPKRLVQFLDEDGRPASPWREGREPEAPGGMARGGGSEVE